MTIVATALAVAVSVPTAAQGPDRATLPADTGFVVHVDLRKLGNLIQIEDLLEHADVNAGEVADILGALKSEWGFDVLRDLRSVTVFGRDPDQDPNVMLITSARLDRVLDALRDADGLASERRGGVRFYRPRPAGIARAFGIDAGDIDDSDDDDVPAFFVHELDGDRRAVLIGEHAEGLVDAARVLTGDARSLARSRDGGLELDASQNAIVYVEIGGSLERLIDQMPASRIGGKIRRLAAEVGASDDELDVRLMAVTGSERDADDVASIVNGLRALVSMAGDSAEIPDLLRETVAEARARADGDKVTIHLSLPLRELRDLLHDEIGGRRKASRRARDRDEDDDADERRRRRRKIR